MTHDPTDLPDDEPGSERNDHLPATEAGARTAPVPRQPMEQVARAMVVQAELMKQMHERQRLLEEVVKDNRRHELVINSAQALNESFQGLQRVQERLADKLEDTGGVSRSRFLVITLALLALAATGGIVAWRLVEKADDFNASLRVALDPKARDREFQDVVSKLEGRIQHVEEADRAAFRDEIEQLRKTRDAITTERDTLRRERDGAREELGAAKASLAGAQSESAEARNKLQGVEKENARLTAEAVASQKTILQLNDVLATMKGAKAAGSPQTASEGETARKSVTPRDPGPPPEKPAEKHLEKPAADDNRPVAPPPAAVGRG
jgi:vacuolar-type H+-ATPase subunit I/STV1